MAVCADEFDASLAAKLVDGLRRGVIRLSHDDHIIGMEIPGLTLKQFLVLNWQLFVLSLAASDVEVELLQPWEASLCSCQFVSTILLSYEELAT